MMKKFRYPLFGLVLVVVSAALVSCGRTGIQPTPTQDRSAAFTAAAQTISAELTLSAAQATEPVPATHTPAPSATPIPSDTPPPTPTATFPVTNTPSPTSTASSIPGVVFEDDFSTGRGWDEQSGDRYGFGFVDNAYRIYVDVLNAPIWSVRNQSFADVRLEVDAARTEGPQDGYYGLICRHVDGSNYYALVIGSNGFYGILKQEDGEHEFLAEGMAPEGVIQSGATVNHLRANCIDESLALFANGRQLAEVQDDDIEEGDIGLVAGTRLEGGLEVVFDNFVVARP